MIEWIVALTALPLGLLGLVIAVPLMMSKARGGGGFAVGLWMVLASVFDPAQAAAAEQIDRKKETEGSEEGESGDDP